MSLHMENTTMVRIMDPEDARGMRAMAFFFGERGWARRVRSAIHLPVPQGV